MSAKKYEEMDLDADRIEVPVNISWTANGKKMERKCVLRDALGVTRDAYMNNWSSRMKPLGDRLVLGSWEGLQSFLISRCLFDATTGQAVSIPDIEAWPARVQEALFNRAKEISGMNDDDEEKNTVKNVSRGTDSSGSESPQG